MRFIIIFILFSCVSHLPSLSDEYEIEGYRSICNFSDFIERAKLLCPEDSLIFRSFEPDEPDPMCDTLVEFNSVLTYDVTLLYNSNCKALSQMIMWGAQQCKNAIHVFITGIDLRSFSNEENVFDSLLHLEDLVLQRCNMDSFPAALIPNKNIVMISLERNHLSTIPPAFYELNNLKILSLRENQFRTLPHELFKIESFEHLDLTLNRHLYLDKLFSSINGKKMSTLELRYCNISELPAEVKYIANIYYLFLNDNNLCNLPKEFEELNGVRWLDLSNNKLQEFPRELLQLDKLYVLSLRNNYGISSIPEDIVKMKGLRFLTVGGTSISKEEIVRLKELLPNTKIDTTVF